MYCCSNREIITRKAAFYANLLISVMDDTDYVDELVTPALLHHLQT